MKANAKTADAGAVLANVARVTGVSVEVIRGSMRTRRVAWARFLALDALRQAFPWWSQSDLGRAVGRGDPSTAAHGLKRAAELKEAEPAFAGMWKDLLDNETSETDERETV